MKPVKPRFPVASALALSAILALPAPADDRTMSFNSEIAVLPAPGAVTIDGLDGDWDLSAGVWSYNDPLIVERYSVWTHMMWDAKGVYMLARYVDSSPMKNAAAGKDFSMSWRADCYQARVVFDDGLPEEHQMHVNMYYSTPDDRPYMIVKHGGFRANPPYDATGPDRPDQLEKWGPTMEAAGGQIAFAPWEDGKGYNMEVFWPWSYCRTSGEALRPGESFTYGIEAMWGNAAGEMLAHRLADGIKDETVNRIFMFRARPGWGRALILDKGGLAVTEEQKALQKARQKNFVDYDTYGSVPIAYTLPADRDVTIAIDDAQGRRVRNLFGQYPRSAGDVTDLWDCLDDNGNPVAPGTYRATVVHHVPIALKFYNSVYSSATPPWNTESGSKLWGANHGHPTSVATRGDKTVLLFTGTEGGSGMQRIDDDGIILWADHNEFVDGTLDDTYSYGLSRSSWQSCTLIARYRVTDGHLEPFEDANRTPNAKILDDANITDTSTIAIAHGALWVFCPGRAFLKIDPRTGTILETLERPEGLRALTDRNEKLFALYADGSVRLLGPDGQPIGDVAKLGGLRDPVRLGIDMDEKRFAVSDLASNQVVLFGADGGRIAAIGSDRPGRDRPAGPFVKTDLIRPLGADFDHLGRLWVAECVTTCKRVTCWDAADYHLVDQYWGMADYGAMAGFPLTFDATRFIAHGIEFQLDPNPDPWHRKTNEEPLVYHPGLAHERGLVYRFNGREYAAGCPGYNKPDSLKIFLRGEDGVFRICTKITWNRRERIDNKWVDIPGTAWTDTNNNHEEDEGEVFEGLDARNLYWSNGWIRPDLSILLTNNKFFRPTGFTEAGAPIYDFAHPTSLGDGKSFPDGQGSVGTPVVDNAGNVSNGIRYQTADGRIGAYPNRYGRHDAPAAQRGVLIAPFRANGVVEDVPGVGSVMALGGDRGEWFLLSMDGLYISSICQDSKGNVVLDETFIGQESFGGFFWRDSATGKVFVQLGGPSYRLMEVTGLETCVRLDQDIEITADDIAKGLAIVQTRQQDSVREPATVTIARTNRLPAEPAPVMQPMSRPLIDGAVDVAVSEEGNKATWWRAALAHNGRDLAMMFQVADPSPWMNAEGRFTHLFIGGDCVDLQLDIPGRGPCRILAAPMGGRGTVVFWQQKAEEPSNPITYSVGNNMANASSFDVVKLVPNAKVQAATGIGTYTVLVTVPLAEIGLSGDALGSTLKGIVGVIYSNPAGDNRLSRLYWHDKATGLVSDVPSESRLSPARWGDITIAK
ncbi:MAG: FlgD immunoglobulin-like domain containing protein [Kiritimatiellia bacterium]